ncbi:MAG TPA: ribosome-associated translation inhibitor RaiA [Thermopetrobacter sp.]|nr:ribosome-associated translation inhibitor RaiA [Thermopetrobacter sp.]
MTTHTMQIRISGKNFDIGAALRGHVEKRLPEVIGKYFDHALTAQVVMEKQRQTFHVECVVHLPTGLVLQTNGSGTDAYAALDEALEHLEKRLRRYKKRLISHTRQRRKKPMPAMEAASFVLAPAPEEPAAGASAEMVTDDAPAIVAEGTERISEMSVDEAVMQLELSNRSFVLFRNARHGGVNVVYWRGDGNIGWVDPGPCAPAD